MIKVPGACIAKELPEKSATRADLSLRPHFKSNPVAFYFHSIYLPAAAAGRPVYFRCCRPPAMEAIADDDGLLPPVK